MVKTGRPAAEIDREEFEKLCQMQCTRDEICGWFGVEDDTLNRWCKRVYGATFSAVFEQKRAGGHASLRRKQWLLADTNASMAIFLGKQYLGQSDNPVQSQDQEDTSAYFDEAGLNG